MHYNTSLNWTALSLSTVLPYYDYECCISLSACLSVWCLDNKQDLFSLSFCCRYTVHLCVFCFLYIQKRNCAPQLQFPHSCVFERFIYIPAGSVHIFSCIRIDRKIVGIYKSSQTHKCGNWDWGRTISFLGIFVSNFRYCVFALYVRLCTVYKFPYIFLVFFLPLCLH